jgi:uncharacterized protein (DUF488 family)
MILTIGHSTRPFDEFLALLQDHRVMLLADVRTVPRSRHNPQYDRDTLARALEAVGLAYRHMPGLGGLRKPRKDSANMGWRNDSFRGYADYMQTREFETALAELQALAERGCVCIMCAEAVPWRCHRSLIGDALLVHGVEVRHIMGPDQTPLHVLTSFAEVHGEHVTYPFALEG